MALINSMKPPRFGKDMREKFFNFDPSYLPVNHGSYGAFPTLVRDHQRYLGDCIGARPDPFIRYELPDMLIEARTVAAGYLGASSTDVVFVPNATTAVNTVLRNLTFHDGDVIIYFSFAYPGCALTIMSVCESTPAEPYCISLVFPAEDDDIVTAFTDACEHLLSQGKRPRIVMFDTVVTFPGVRLPWERLTSASRDKGVLSLIDGAHGVGHIDLTSVNEVEPDFFTSNCYKWLLTPRSCAILYVPRRNHHLIHTSFPTSHGFRPSYYKGEKPSFANIFKWVATVDQTPYLCVPKAANFRNDICGGEDSIRKYCFELAQVGGELVAKRLGTEVMHNSTFSLNQCCFTNVKLPLKFTCNTNSVTGERAGSLDLSNGVVIVKWIMERCMIDHNTWIQGKFYNGAAWIRLSAQIYLDLSDFEKASEILASVCSRVDNGEWTI